MADEILLQAMGRRISRRRKECELTQEQVAERMDVSVQMISNLELGKKAIRPENLVKLCGILRVSADYILTGICSDAEVDGIARKISTLRPKQQRVITELVDCMIEDTD